MDETLKQKRDPMGREVHRMAPKLKKTFVICKKSFMTTFKSAPSAKSAPSVKRMDETLKQKRNPAGYKVHHMAKTLKETLKGGCDSTTNW